ncbi:MAG: hypothetical protein KGL39_52060 [Patescibacteria group bacterium]|nr:hypothetical protein [Patescibacteria group bacterium]
MDAKDQTTEFKLPTKEEYAQKVAKEDEALYVELINAIAEHLNKALLGETFLAFDTQNVKVISKQVCHRIRRTLADAGYPSVRFYINTTIRNELPRSKLVIVISIGDYTTIEHENANGREIYPAA